MTEIAASTSLLRQLNESWHAGNRVTVEQLVGDLPIDDEVLLDLIYEEYRLRKSVGVQPEKSEYFARFARLHDQLKDLFEVHDALSTLLPNDLDEVGHDNAHRTVGELVAGRFEIREHLGSGTYANVWRAWDRKLQREVALKVPIRLGRFWKPALLREARSAAKLFHPNIVPVYEVADDIESPYIVTAFIDGGNLRQLGHGGRVSLATSLEICRSLALALSFAHDSGIIHRDLKPANVLLNKNHVPFIADFGLARSIESNESDNRIGTPAYMSPEQLHSESIDCRADIYSLGLILYELICGERHPSGADFDAASERRLQLFTNKYDVIAVCARALEISPANRYESALQFAEDLECCALDKPLLHAAKSASWATLLSLSRRTMMRHGLAAAGTLAISAAGIATFGYFSPTSKPDLARRIRIDTKPSGASISFVSLSPNNADPMRGSPVASGVSPFATTLNPGDYLVVASLESGAIVEAYRHVPYPGELSSARLPHLMWNLSDNGDLILPKLSTGNFSSESCSVSERLYFRDQLVSLGEFQRFIAATSFRYRVDERQTVLVHFDTAVAFAESIGMRLPTVKEWLALRDAGMTCGEIPEWTVTAIANPGIEQTEPGQFGRFQCFCVQSNQDHPAAYSRFTEMAAIRCVRRRS